jgi:aldehyde:ferredoxin oxidoreductase
MGSKNLKAIGVRGTKSIPVADPTRFRRSVKNAFSEIRKNRATSETYPKYGTTALVEILNGFGILPAKNWQELPSLEIEQITAKALRESFVVKDVYCAPPCPVKCSKVTFAKAGFYAGALTEGPEYETIFAFGPCCGVYDASTIIAADAYCDQYGLDTISAGVSIAFAMECFEKQIIDRVMTEGDELRFGNKDLIVPMLHKIAYRKGFGRILAQGTKKMAEEFGKGTSDFAMHAKGMELGGYDPRGVKGMAIVFACGPRGGCHHAGGFTVFLEVLSGEFDRFAESGKASLVKKTRDRRASVCDSGSLCTFGAFGMSDEVIANMISAVTGCDLSTADIYTIGERIGCIERCFNVREGLNRGWDILPTRFLKESMHGGPNQGQTVHLSMMIDEFYESCGWDTENGSPIPAKLKELGLEWISHSHSDRERNLS